MGSTAKMLFYATGNQDKVEAANNHLKPFGITVRGIDVDTIIEPQTEHIEEISKSKAQQAFEQVKQKLIVSDSGWRFAALNGFPGPYMAFMNRWFSAQDFLNLMKGKKNREVVLRECVAYADNTQIKTFTCDTKGQILDKASGEGTPLDQITTFRRDRKSVASCRNENLQGIPQNELWDEVGKWITNKTA